MKKYFTLLALVFLSVGGYAQYCIPSYTNGITFGDSIVSFQLGTINASFPGSTTGYNDYTALASTNLNAGGTYTATMLCNPTFQMTVGIWIDYNNNQVFDPAEKLGEVVILGGQTGSLTFTVPASATTGTTRLRMMAVYFPPGALTPCGSYGFGETEDYGINILPPPPNDVGVTSLSIPPSACGLSATEPVTVQLTNFGVNAQTTFPVSYSLNGATPITETFTGSLTGQGGTAPFTFAATANVSLPNTAYVIQVWTSLVGDGDASNDTLTFAFTTPNVAALPLFEDFETFTAGSPGVLGPGWSRSGGGNFEGWIVGQAPTQYSTNTGPITNNTPGGSRYMFIESSGGFNGSTYDLNAPCLSLVGATTPRLSFFYHMYGATTGSLSVLVRNGSSTGTDTTIFSISGQQQTSETAPWTEVILDLTPWAGSSIELAFRGVRGTSFTGDIAIDDVNVYQPSATDISPISAAPSGQTCLSSAETITVDVRNLGANIINFATNPLTVTVNITGASTQTFTSALINTGTLGILDTLTVTVTTTANLSAPGVHVFSVATTMVGDGTPGNNNVTAGVQSLPIFPVPFTETFETFAIGSPGTLANGWTIEGGGAFEGWTVEQNGIQNNTLTGPIQNHTPGGQIYMYTETSSGILGNQYRLVSPCLDLAGVTSPRLSFRYHMYGATTGTLAVEVRTPSGTTQIWSLSGQQQTAESDPWLLGTADLTPFAGQSVQIVFLGIRGSSFTGDLAIDDVSVFQPAPIDVAGVGVTAPESGCGLSGAEAITFDFTNFGTSPLSSVVASYSLNGGPFTTPENVPGTLLPGDTTAYTFTTLANLSIGGVYNIQVVVTQISPADTVPINDTINYTVQNFPAYAGTYPYYEDFESGNGGWSSGGLASSWAFGTPNKTTIIGASSGINAWVNGGLDLTFFNNATFPAGGEAGRYNTGENSFVVSPCFDFTTLDTPVVRMDIWWNSEFSWDGAVLQSTIDGGLSWQNVGSFNDPNNWYNDNTINGNPGGQQEGWTGRNSTGNGSGGWVTASHRLDGLGGETQVLLRIAFGSDASVQDDGFAFDNVAITEFSPVNGQMEKLAGPVTGCGLSDSAVVSVTYSNVGTAPITSYTVGYTIVGSGTVVTESPGDTIQPGQSLTYEFATTADFSTTGTYQVQHWISAALDTDVVNDTSISTVIHKTPISTFPYFQNFDGPQWVLSPATFPIGIPVVTLPDDWENSQDDDPQDWAVRSGTSGFNTGPAGDHTTGTTKYLFVDDSSPANHDSVILISPCFDVTALNSPLMSFWYHSNNSNQPNNENELHIDLIFNGNLIFDIVPPIGHKDNNWNLLEIDMSQYIGNFAVRFRVNNDNNFGNHDIAIDDFRIVDVLPQDAGITLVAEPLSGCGLPANDTLVLALANLGIDTIFGGLNVNYSVNGGTVNTVAITDTLLPGFLIPVNFPGINFSTPGDYVVTAWTSGLTGDSNLFNDSVTTIIKSIPQVTTFPYIQDFESGDGGWVVETAQGAASSWGFGTPAKPVIQGAFSGVNAWATALDNSYLNSQGQAGAYNPNEDSWVISPCFDFTNLSSPIIEMAVWWSSEFSWDGAVLQSTVDNGATWQNVGAFNDPDNWYNDNTINGAPGGQQIGWTGTAANSSGGWVIAKNNMDSLAGEPEVRLRVAFGSDGFVQFDGFAFDDILIFERPGDDMGVEFIDAPLGSICGEDSTVIEVTLTNFGSDTAFTVPVFASITGASTATISATFTGVVAPGASVPFTIGTFNTISGGTFQIAAYTAYVGDTLAFNDTAFSVIDVSVSALTPMVIGDSICATDSAEFTLVASTAVGGIRWYSDASGNTLVHEGDTFVTPFLNTSATYYAQATTQDGFSGFTPATNAIGLGASNNFFGDGLVFNVEQDLVINTVRVYPFSAGNITVNVLDAGGANVATKSFVFGGTVPDTVLTLDFVVPVGNGYRMNANGSTVTGLYSNQAGAIYPYTQPGVISITQAINNLAGFYYFFYDWTVTSFGCPSPLVPVEASFLPAASVNLGPDGIECAGFALDASDPNLVSYLWNTGETTPTIQANSSGLYYVDVINTFGCEGSDSVSLTINPSPSVDLGPSTVTACGTVTLDAGNPGATYVWSEPGQFGQTLQVTTSGTYFVTVNLLGCEDSDTVTVTVSPAPVVDLGPNIASCTPVTLNAGNPGANYIWSTGETTQSISVVPPVTGSDTITVVVTNSAFCDAVDEIIISAGVPPVVNLGPDVEACDSVVLNAGIANATYLWTPGGATTQTLSVKASAIYTVSVIDALGCEGTDEIEVTVNQKPVADFVIDNLGNFTYGFSSSAAGVTSYEWDFGDGAPVSNAPNPTHQYQFPGLYVVSLTVTNECGTDRKDVTLTGVSIDEAFGQSIKVSPNPTRSEFFVSSETFTGTELSIEVNDTRGRLVYRDVSHNVYGGFRIRVDLAGQPEGVYLVKISDGERTTYKRVVRE